MVLFGCKMCVFLKVSFIIPNGFHFYVWCSAHAQVYVNTTKNKNKLLNEDEEFSFKITINENDY